MLQVFRQTTLGELRSLPIRNISSEEQNKIVVLVNQILKAKKENQDANTSNLENEIDILVYKLYGLTYEEVLIIDSDFELTEKEYFK